MTPKLIAASITAFTVLQLNGAQVGELESKDAIKVMREFEKNDKLLKREYLDERSQLDEKHQANFDANKNQLIAGLEAALEKEAKAVNLEEANKINNLLAVRKARACSLPSPSFDIRGGASMKILPQSMVGDWDGTWGTTGNKIQLRLSETGDSNHGPITFKNNRILLMERKSEYIELIPYNGKILVLGYYRKNRHPDSTLPDHIGIVARSKRTHSR